ncbi:hypothetical protein K461DRAFT_290636 [Myriangium duriaei CBS 260.36]|uniref:F-box domain-containing protein n=1 Tax=Myriangium duriaei CBS 260.36 TaxID=1168546 RepID=A0A9P4J5U3_9PEZI|nr:hypothetical protein K461DRAFT_290636 [Myriangium duriaei CBS 260.36]
MDLTPIRIRGARHGTKRLSSFTKMTSSKKRRRIAGAEIGANKSGASLQGVSKKSGHSLSSIEKLPLEILEAIFANAPNLALPLSSPSLSKALASEKMFAVCASTWFMPSGSATHKDVTALEQVEYDESSANEWTTSVDQINRLMACRWMTWSRFKIILGNILVHHDFDDDNEGFGAFQMDFEQPWKQYRFPDLKIGSAVNVPEKLLRGPWSPDKSQFLYYLCFLGLQVDWDRSTAGEVASHGLEDAIKARDRIAVVSLLSDQVSVLPSQDSLRSAIMDHGCDQTIIFHLLDACIRAKSREHDGLMEHGKMRVKPLDSVIWSWLKRYEAAAQNKAKWLKGALTTTASMMSDTATGRDQKHKDFKAACGQKSSGVIEIPVPRPTRTS